MEQRISLITLAVTDLDRAARFYEALGWARCDGPDGIVAFDLIGQTLGLYPRQSLADDLGIPAEAIGGFSGITLAHNLRQRDEVAALMARAEAAGARMLKPAQEVFWGGLVGYFADPDGHVWEIAWNPHAPLSPEGAFCWNGYDRQ